MKHFVDAHFASLATLALVVLLGANTAHAQTTAFTYQGRLTDGSNPANGVYDLQFRLFDALSGGNQVGATLIRDDVTVTNGIFSVTLDFGALAFPGANRFLEIAVRPGASTGAFTPLAPLQPLSSTPYAIRSLSAAAADALSAACAGCVTSGQIGGLIGSQISGAIPVASVPAGSGNYIQNTTARQASSNFNISGNGIAGGTLAANLVNATTQYQLGGARVLSADGAGNTFAGLNAGAANTTGSRNTFFGNAAGSANTEGVNNAFFGHLAGAANTLGHFNSFFGRQAGAANTTGRFNSFFGESAGNSSTTGNGNSTFGQAAGLSNLTGNFNSFFGASAGAANTTGSDNTFFGVLTGSANTTGGSNAFFGEAAGDTNLTGSNNTIIGARADVAGGNLSFATAIGAGAVVASSNTIVLGRGANQDAVQIPGPLNVIGALTASGANLTNLNANNITSGLLPANFGGTGLVTAGPAGNYLRSIGTLWTSAPLQAADLPPGNANYIQNSLTQQIPANFNIGGDGTAGGTLSANVVNALTHFSVGGARVLSAIGSNTFAGLNAGRDNTTGIYNAFFGRAAGITNTTGSDNAFFGDGAGSDNRAGEHNSFFGGSAGRANTTGSQNTIIGNGAEVGSNNLSNATALGARAMVSQSNSLVLGSINTVNGATANTRVGIGITNPDTTLHVRDGAGENGTIRIGNNSVGGAGEQRLILFGDGANVYVGEEDADDRLVLRGGFNGVRFKGPITNVAPDSDNQTDLGTATNRWFRVFAVNGTIQTSDSRLKKGIRNLNYGLRQVMQLRPIDFQWKDGADRSRHIGLIAQEVERILPEAISRSQDPAEPLGMNYGSLVPVLVKAIQEQQAELERRAAQLEQLQQRLLTLERKLKRSARR